MRKVLAILLVLGCLLMLGGCKESEQQPDTKPSATQPTETDPTEDPVQVDPADYPYFTGTVTEKFEGGCIVKVTNRQKGSFAAGQEVEVHTDFAGCPEYQVGDSLTITYDGKVTHSLPPQVVCVSAIQVNE